MKVALFALDGADAETWQATHGAPDLVFTPRSMNRIRGVLVDAFAWTEDAADTPWFDDAINAVAPAMLRP